MGDATDHLYYVASGRIRTSIIAPDRTEYVVGLFSPGELFGELCFCSVRRRQEQAIAVTDARVIRVEVPHLISLASRNQAEVTSLVELFCQRMGDLQNQLTEVSLASIRTRLGLLLLRLAEGGQVGTGGLLRCRDSLTHEEMAARLSITRDQVSSILAGFRGKGLIDYRRGSPIYVDTQRLTTFLETAS